MIIMTNNLKEHIRKVLLEESLKQKLKKIVDDHELNSTIRIVGGFRNLSKILELNDKEVDELIYKYLTENYSPDYEWGPELHHFYKKDVETYGSHDFETNNRLSYTYFGAWNGRDYLYTLVIEKWFSNELTLLFENKWIPVFKKWFEDNSGLEVINIKLNEE